MGTVTTTALACLLAGAALTGCGTGGDGGEKSAGDLLDEANATMRKLNSVTVDITNRTTDGFVTSHLVTDLDSRCRSRTTYSASGTLEQIRLGGTDYVRPDRAYLQKWRNTPGLTDDPKLWAETPVDPAASGNGLTSCERPFDSFGTARKGGTTRVGDTEAIKVIVTDKADKAGTYTFYVATEGRPYLLKTVYKSATQQTTTAFGGFDVPLDIQAPEADEILRVPGGSR
ncbi:hypothetical protein ABZ499_29855 [Streptomyces sp. NPDC019990]|uniref:hypothetical protein n=1 Tax=Streptomyces sp. NPDC019990 TaxID=3154693 RepID=UPI0033D9FE02